MKVKFGNGVADGRGSIGGTTFSRNRYGSYARTRVTPVNPNTPSQIRSRANFQANATAWRSLTDSQRTSWSNYAAATPVIDSLGNTIYYSGMQAYMSVIGIYGTVNAAVPATTLTVPEAPTVPNGTQTDDITSFILQSDLEDGLTVTIAGGGVAGTVVGEYAAIFVGRPVSKTVRYYNGPWRAAALVLKSGATPTTTAVINTGALLALDIVPTSGCRTFVKLVRFSTVNTRIPAIRQSSVTWA